MVARKFVTKLFLRQDCIKKSHFWLVSDFLVAPAGIEPATQGFSVLCSTDWAMKPSWRFVRDLNPWSLAWQASVIDHYTNEPLFGCGRGIWTHDLRVMSPTSYQTATIPRYYHWRRKRDSNPCADFSTCRFSRPIPSTGLGYSSIHFLNAFWL